MKFWTLQTKEVCEIVKSEGIYQPDFAKSEYIRFNNDLYPLYDFLLKSFNAVNHVYVPGLVFAFTGTNGSLPAEIRSIADFKHTVMSKWDVVNTLWEHYKNRDMVIMELDYNDNFNPLFIDYNDYQFIMPPVMVLPHFTHSDLSRIMNNIAKGIFMPSKFPGGFIQAHLPNIKQDNITAVHEMFYL